jgi:hypothetical protein
MRRWSGAIITPRVGTAAIGEHGLENENKLARLRIECEQQEHRQPAYCGHREKPDQERTPATPIHLQSSTFEKVDDSWPHMHLTCDYTTNGSVIQTLAFYV